MSALAGFDLQPHLSTAGFDAMTRFAAAELPAAGPATLAPRHDVQFCTRCGSIWHESNSLSCPRRTSGGVR